MSISEFHLVSLGSIIFSQQHSRQLTHFNLTSFIILVYDELKTALSTRIFESERNRLRWMNMEADNSRSHANQATSQVRACSTCARAKAKCVQNEGSEDKCQRSKP